MKYGGWEVAMGMFACGLLACKLSRRRGTHLTILDSIKLHTTLLQRLVWGLIGECNCVRQLQAQLRIEEQLQLHAAHPIGPAAERKRVRCLVATFLETLAFGMTYCNFSIMAQISVIRERERTRRRRETR